MPVTLTDSWIPTPADNTRVLNIGAGVTARQSVQVTNNTSWELWINDSAVPPDSSENATFTVPPRATANYPLGSSTFAARWSGSVAQAGDRVTFVFTDDVAVPSVMPGVQAQLGGASPVQFGDSGSTFPLTITTTSGLNVGQLFVYNKTCTPVSVVDFPTFSVEIPAYSWATLPLNRPSGSFFVGWPSLFPLPDDSLLFAWSDINYTGPFPSGAGPLPTPFELSFVSGLVSGPLSIPNPQFWISNGLLGAGAVALYTLLPQQAVYINRLFLQASTPGPFIGTQVSASNGYSGNNIGAPELLGDLGAGPAAENLNVTFDTDIFVSNQQAIGSGINNIIQLVAVGAGFTVSRGGIGGWRVA